MSKVGVANAPSTWRPTCAPTSTPGGPVTLPYTVSDASGKATVHLQLYQDGAPVAAERVLRGAATGARQLYAYPLPGADAHRPALFCVWAESKGGKSVDAPKSSCAWVPFLVDYHGWSRMAVDSKFLRDLRKLCHTAATPPASDVMA